MSRPPAAPPPSVPTSAFLARFFGRDRFAAGAGIRLVEVGSGRAVARMRVRPEHLNGVDVVQGGAIFTLADFAFAVACNTAGPVALAIDVSISFLAATSRGTLTATAVEAFRSSKLSRVEVEVRDGRGTRVALFHGTAYVTRDSLEAVAARAAAQARASRKPRAARSPRKARHGTSSAVPGGRPSKGMRNFGGAPRVLMSR